MTNVHLSRWVNICPYFGNGIAQVGIAQNEPTTRCDTVGLVLELLGREFKEGFEAIQCNLPMAGVCEGTTHLQSCFQQVRVNLRHPVHRVRALKVSSGGHLANWSLEWHTNHNGQMRHVDTLVTAFFHNRQITQAIAITRIASSHFLRKQHDRPKQHKHDALT